MVVREAVNVQLGRITFYPLFLSETGNSYLCSVIVQLLRVMFVNFIPLHILIRAWGGVVVKALRY